MILVIVLFLVGCAGVGKLVNRASDRNIKLFGPASGRGRQWRTSHAVADPVENTRGLDDGTDFGYQEFD